MEILLGKPCTEKNVSVLSYTSIYSVEKGQSNNDIFSGKQIPTSTKLMMCFFFGTVKLYVESGSIYSL